MTKILLAEDHDDNREMLLRRLARAGYEARGVCDGAEAVQAALEWNPDLILMDVSMPVMSGLDATRHLREQPGADFKVIALTAHAMNESREACLEAGCDGFATKPVDLPALLVEIERQLALPPKDRAA
jgi:two-component system, cell cycle response regulator DivK